MSPTTLKVIATTGHLRPSQQPTPSPPQPSPPHLRRPPPLPSPHQHHHITPSPPPSSSAATAAPPSQPPRQHTKPPIVNIRRSGLRQASFLLLLRQSSFFTSSFVPKVDDVSLVDGVFDGAFGGDEEEDFVMRECVVLPSSSLDMSTKSCLGGMMVSLIFLEGLEEEAWVESMEVEEKWRK
ncbi:hypothetical protein Tco_0988546 [Tanacetum coccineum]|uniref:Uncharacterized protein n=1 Tax=Tanacetum coccineum TaxID=301880 RepID=A0ABQ5ERF6_9ASTR